MRREVILALCVALLVALAGCGGEVDRDGDGLNKTVEERHGLSDRSADTDGDGLGDKRELQSDRLNATKADTDGDGLNDSEELSFGSDPSVSDTDGDGLDDAEEYRLKTDPRESDTDGDGVPDGAEIENGTSPTSRDTDGDGLDDKEEIKNGVTEPDNPDTDGDGLNDGRERELGTDPGRADTDGDGLLDGTEVEIGTNPTKRDTDGDGLSDGEERRLGTDPTSADTDGDGRTDLEEHEADGLDPTRKEVRTINGSEQAGLANASLRNEALEAVGFLADLPQNRTKRNETIVATATTICNTHDRAVPENATNATDVGKDVYRNTYRVAQTAGVLDDRGADIDVGAVEKQMRTVRRHSGLAEQYAPVLGSYNRLHDASCAVKQGEPGAKEDFYIASAEFAVDLALAKEGVIYRASFKTTGMASRTIGVNRLAGVCGWKCVGLVQSEVHWLVRGTYSGALDTVSKTAIEGNVTVQGWNESVRRNIGESLENRTNATLVGGQLEPETKVMRCVDENVDPKKDLPGITADFGFEAADVLRTMLEERRLPKSADLSFLTEIDGVQSCLNE